MVSWYKPGVSKSSITAEGEKLENLVIGILKRTLPFRFKVGGIINSVEDT